jgi:hypothetical protein
VLLLSIVRGRRKRRSHLVATSIRRIMVDAAIISMLQLFHFSLELFSKFFEMILSVLLGFLLILIKFLEPHAKVILWCTWHCHPWWYLSFTKGCN